MLNLRNLNPAQPRPRKATSSAPGQAAFFEILHRGNLGRRMVAAALLSCAAFSSGSAAAQEERPQITPGERKVPRKKDAGPRAVAVLQMSANGKVSLVPIALLVSGKFWDATAYKADPVPMALDSGTVYEAERTGSSQGLFTVNTALHSTAPNAPTPWIGTGAWVPLGTEKAGSALQAEAAPVGIDGSDAPPRLSRTPASAAPPTSTAPAGTTPRSPPASPPSSGDEPPRLNKPRPASAPPASAPAPTPSSTAPTADSKGSSGPTQTGSTPPPSGSTAPQPGKKPEPENKAGDEPPLPPSDSGAGEGNRPKLRRGKPAESFADEDVPGYSRPGLAPAKSMAKSEPRTAPAPVQLIPAISDAAGPQPRSYAFEWLKDEEGERRKQIEDLARQQLRAYLETQARNHIGPDAKPGQASHHGAAKKPAEPVFENVEMVAYDLWTTNQAIIVFSAQAHMPPPPTGSQGGAQNDLEYSIMLVAYPDIYNNLHKLYSGITDKFHLDIVPRLDLVDAVDADGDGRGELLFRETSDAGTGWMIYRATADRLWKLFDSLNPQ